MLAVLAHQGGWDEVLLVGAPIVAIVALLAIAKRRADAALRVGAPSEVDRGHGREHSEENAG